ncbi:MAG: glycosyltransferase family 2 protein [Thermomicrobiales bacterium]
MPIDAPVITALIPTYQRPHLLRRAIRSVLDQTYPNLRVSIFDNASGDETAAVVEEFAREDPRVIYHCHAENIGVSANFTYAMEHVDTPFFSFLADDDFYLPTFFETAMAGFTEHPDAMCSAGAVVYITESGGVLLVSSLEGYFVPPDGLLEWVAGKYPSITGFVFRSELNERVGTMDTAILHADYDYLLRVLPRFPHVLSATPCMVVVYHDQQSTKRAGIDVRLRTYRHLQGRLQNIDALPANIRGRMEDDLYTTFVNSVFTTGLHALCDKDFALAHDAVAALRDPFGMKRKATMLALVTTACQKSTAIRRFLCLLRTLALKSSRYLRARKYRPMESELKDLVSAMETSRA